jgi:hypothetical protein
LFIGRIFYGEPVSTSPENAPAKKARENMGFPALRGASRQSILDWEANHAELA